MDNLVQTGANLYHRHRPEQTLLYKLVEKYYPIFISNLADQGTTLPCYVDQTFRDYLECGRLEHGFLRVQCEKCHAERLVAFSCKRRGFCPSCSASRMVESAALLMTEILPEPPHRQWVLSVPTPLRWLFAQNSEVMGKALRVVIRVIMMRAQRLKRVFNIDISDCNQCGSRVKVIACSENPDAISKILTTETTPIFKPHN